MWLRLKLFPVSEIVCSYWQSCILTLCSARHFVCVVAMEVCLPRTLRCEHTTLLLDSGYLLLLWVGSHSLCRCAGFQGWRLALLLLNSSLLRLRRLNIDCYILTDQVVPALLIFLLNKVQDFMLYCPEVILVSSKSEFDGISLTVGVIILIHSTFISLIFLLGNWLLLCLKALVPDFQLISFIWYVIIIEIGVLKHPLKHLFPLVPLPLGFSQHHILSWLRLDFPNICSWEQLRLSAACESLGGGLQLSPLSWIIYQICLWKLPHRFIEFSIWRWLWSYICIEKLGISLLISFVGGLVILRSDV